MTKQTRLLTALGAVGLCSIAGCELAVDFDRTTIDSGAFDASVSETSTDAPSVGDALGDGNTPEDTGVDASADAPGDSSDSGAAVDAADGSDAADD